jgi:hypothetical protein
VYERGHSLPDCPLLLGKRALHLRKDNKDNAPAASESKTMIRERQGHKVLNMDQNFNARPSRPNYSGCG